MISFLSENYEWIFSGVGVSLIVFLVHHFSKDSKEPNDVGKGAKNKIVIKNTIKTGSEQKKRTESEKEDARQKEKTRILFVDDEHTQFKMVSILKKAGWINTKSIKDITDLDDVKAKEADFIFVDINGVGTTLFEDQGLGLASALKKKYNE